MIAFSLILLAGAMVLYYGLKLVFWVIDWIDWEGPPSWLDRPDHRLPKK